MAVRRVSPDTGHKGPCMTLWETESHEVISRWAGLGTWNEIEVLLLSCQSLAGGVVINRWSYRSSLVKKIRVADLLLYIKSHLLGLVCLWEVLLDSYGQSISQICSISLQVPIPLYPIFLRSDVSKCHLRIDSKEDWNTG